MPLLTPHTEPRKKQSTSYDDFLVLESIGTGTFGTCSKVMRKSDRKVGERDTHSDRGVNTIKLVSRSK